MITQGHRHMETNSVIQRRVCLFRVETNSALVLPSFPLSSPWRWKVPSVVLFVSLSPDNPRYTSPFFLFLFSLHLAALAPVLQVHFGAFAQQLPTLNGTKHTKDTHIHTLTHSYIFNHIHYLFLQQPDQRVVVQVRKRVSWVEFRWV